MAHRHEEEQEDGVLENGDMAEKTGGSLGISPYEATSWAFRRLISAGKKAPALPQKALILISGLGKSGKTHQLETKIGFVQKKLKRLHYKIGEIGISYSGEGNVLETEPVKELIAEVREKEAKIDGMRAQIVEIKKQKEKKKKKKKRKAVKKAPVAIGEEAMDKKHIDALKTAIDDAVLSGEFESSSEMEIFQKVANDLLDDEIEVQILAVAELGKMGKGAAVPILLEASESINSDLVSEIVNSLISLGDLQALPLFRKRASDPGYRVRIGCLRGLYKLSDQEDDVPVLTEALRDEHPEVRRTAATFLGWKDSVAAAPPLTQCLRDEDRRVRKAVVSALAHLKDESSILPLIRVLEDEDVEIRRKALQTIQTISGNDDLSFDVDADAPALAAAASQMRDWWEKERLDRVHEDRPDAESIETGTTETETDIEDIPIPVVDGEAPEEADPKTEDIDDASGIDEDIVPEDEPDAFETPEQDDGDATPEQDDGDATPEEETASEDTEDETFQEEDASGIDEDIAPDDEPRDEPDAFETPEQDDGDATPEEDTASEDTEDETAQEEDASGIDEDIAPDDEPRDETDAFETPEQDDGDATPEEDTASEDTEDETEDEPVEETVEREDHQYREWQLSGMVKAKLLSICHDLDIEADENMLRSELIALVLEKKE